MYNSEHLHLSIKQNSQHLKILEYSRPNSYLIYWDFFRRKSGETLDFWQEKLENDIGDASADTLLVSKAGRCSWEVKADRQAGRLSCSLTSQLSFCRSKKPVFRRIASLEETPELLLSIAWIWLTNYLCRCRSIANCNCNGALRAPATCGLIVILVIFLIWTNLVKGLEVDKL